MKFLLKFQGVLQLLVLLVAACSLLMACGSDDNGRPEIEGFVWIKPGTFMMGSPSDEPERRLNEPYYQVILTKGFYMSKYELTVGEFRRFINDSGYVTDAEKGIDGVFGGYAYIDHNYFPVSDANWDNPYFDQNENHPVSLVSWFDAIHYCNWLSEQEGLTPAYMINGNDVIWNRNANGYRLPTEAEWEYACRAGTTTPFNVGWNITSDQANYNAEHPYNGNPGGEYRAQAIEVGSFEPNAWGLYDMHGNVLEWCWNWDYNSDLDYPSRTLTDPLGPSSGPHRVLRGGSWYWYGNSVRSARRGSAYGAPIATHIGFRLVRP